MPEISEFLPKSFLERQGITLPEVLKSLKRAGDEFTIRLEQSALYIPVAEGKWSPAQISDHIGSANLFFAKCLDRTINGKAPMTMPKGHVTDDGRALSPAGEPRADRTRHELLEDHLGAFEALERHGKTIENLGLLETTCVQQSFFGAMTSLEVLRLCAWHTRHHAAQIQLNS